MEQVIFINLKYLLFIFQNSTCITVDNTRLYFVVYENSGAQMVVIKFLSNLKMQHICNLYVRKSREKHTIASSILKKAT